MQRAMLVLQLDRPQLIDMQFAKLSGMIAQAMKPQQEAVMRLAEVPRLGVDSRNRSLPKWGSKPVHSPRRRSRPFVWGLVRGKRNARRRTEVVARREATNICGGLNQAAHAAVKPSAEHPQVIDPLMLNRAIEGFNK
jgi:hypothetical protein